jgi:hypothetical protein
MKITQKYPRQSYPYLAVWTGVDNYLEKSEYNPSEVVMISMLQENQGEDLKPFVQYLDGSKEGYFTKSEKDFTPLPNGYEITLTQTEEN